MISWGVAIGAYPGMIVPAIAHLKVSDDGDVVISVGGHEMVWADRKPIARVRGRIEYRTFKPSSQYFMFGPSRDPERYEACAMIAKYRRGAIRESLE